MDFKKLNEKIETLLEDRQSALDRIRKEMEQAQKTVYDVAVKVDSIEWDVNEEDANDNNCSVEDILKTLPKTFKVTIEFDEDEITEKISEAITNKYGYLHKGFTYHLA